MDVKEGCVINGEVDKILFVGGKVIFCVEVSSDEEGGFEEDFGRFICDCFKSDVWLFVEEFVVLVTEVSIFDVFDVFEVISSEVSVGKVILLKSKSNISWGSTFGVSTEAVVEVWTEESWFKEGLLLLKGIAELSLCELSMTISI